VLLLYSPLLVRNKCPARFLFFWCGVRHLFQAFFLLAERGGGVYVRGIRTCY